MPLLQKRSEGKSILRREARRRAAVEEASGIIGRIYHDELSIVAERGVRESDLARSAPAGEGIKGLRYRCGRESSEYETGPTSTSLSPTPSPAPTAATCSVGLPVTHAGVVRMLEIHEASQQRGMRRRLRDFHRDHSAHATATSATHSLDAEAERRARDVAAQLEAEKRGAAHLRELKELEAAARRAREAAHREEVRAERRRFSLADGVGGEAEGLRSEGSSGGNAAVGSFTTAQLSRLDFAPGTRSGGGEGRGSPPEDRTGEDRPPRNVACSSISLRRSDVAQVVQLARRDLSTSSLLPRHVSFRPRLDTTTLSPLGSPALPSAMVSPVECESSAVAAAKSMTVIPPAAFGSSRHHHLTPTPAAGGGTSASRGPAPLTNWSAPTLNTEDLESTLPDVQLGGRGSAESHQSASELEGAGAAEGKMAFSSIMEEQSFGSLSSPSPAAGRSVSFRFHHGSKDGTSGVVPLPPIRRGDMLGNMRVQLDRRGSLHGRAAASPMSSLAAAATAAPFDPHEWVAQRVLTTSCPQTMDASRATREKIERAVRCLKRDQVLLAAHERREIVRDLELLLQAEQDMHQASHPTGTRSVAPSGENSSEANATDAQTERRLRQEDLHSRLRALDAQNAQSMLSGQLAQAVLLEAGAPSSRCHALYHEERAFRDAVRERQEASRCTSHDADVESDVVEARNINNVNAERPIEGGGFDVNEEVVAATGSEPSCIQLASAEPERQGREATTDEMAPCSSGNNSDGEWSFVENPGSQLFDIRQAVPCTTDFMDTFGIGRSRHIVVHSERDLERSTRLRRQKVDAASRGRSASSAELVFGLPQSTARHGVAAASAAADAPSSALLSPQSAVSEGSRASFDSPESPGMALRSPKPLSRMSVESLVHNLGTPHAATAAAAKGKGKRRGSRQEQEQQQQRLLSAVVMEQPAARQPRRSTNSVDGAVRLIADPLGVSVRDASSPTQDHHRDGVPTESAAPSISPALFTLGYDVTGNKMTEILCDEATGLPVSMVRFGQQQRDETAKRRFVKQRALARRRELLLATHAQQVLEEQLLQELQAKPLELFLEVFFVAPEELCERAGRNSVDTSLITESQLNRIGAAPIRAMLQNKVASAVKRFDEKGRAVESPSMNASAAAAGTATSGRKLGKRGEQMNRGLATDSVFRLSDLPGILGPMHAESAVISLYRSDLVSQGQWDTCTEICVDRRAKCGFLRLTAKGAGNFTPQAEQCRRAFEWLHLQLNTGAHPAVVRARRSHGFEPEEIQQLESPRVLGHAPPDEEQWFEIDPRQMLCSRFEAGAGATPLPGALRRCSKASPGTIAGAAATVGDPNSPSYTFKRSKAAFGGAIARQQAERHAQLAAAATAISASEDDDNSSGASASDEGDPSAIHAGGHTIEIESASASNSSSRSSGDDDDRDGAPAFVQPTQAERLEHLYRLHNVVLRPGPIKVFKHDEHHDVAKKCATCVFARPTMFCSTCGIVQCKSCFAYVHHPPPGRSNVVYPGTTAEEPSHHTEALSSLAKAAASMRFEVALQQQREEQKRREMEEKLEKEEAARRNQHIAFKLMMEQHALGGALDVSRLDTHVAEAYHSIAKKMESGESIEGLDFAALRALRQSSELRQQHLSGRTSDSGGAPISDRSSTAYSRRTGSLHQSLARSHSSLSDATASGSSGSGDEAHQSVDGAGESVASIKRGLRRKKLLSAADEDGARLGSSISSAARGSQKKRLKRRSRTRGDESGASLLSCPSSEEQGAALLTSPLVPQVMEDPFELWLRHKRQSAATDPNHRFAVVAAIDKFLDSAVDALPSAGPAAFAVAQRLRALGYDVDVMMPTTIAVGSELHLVPTLENLRTTIGTLTSCVQTRQQHVLVVVITRGVVGTLTDIHLGGRQFIALAHDSSTTQLSASTCIIPKLFAAEFEDKFARPPTVFVDAWPLQSASFAMDHPGCGFGAFLARKGAYGELFGAYPKATGGLLTYYLLRALEGRAVEASARAHASPTSQGSSGPTAPFGRVDSSGEGGLCITPCDLHAFFLPRLQRRGCVTMGGAEEALPADGSVVDPVGVATSGGDAADVNVSFSGLDGSQQLNRTSSDSFVHTASLKGRKTSRKISQAEKEQEEAQARTEAAEAAKQELEKQRDTNGFFPLFTMPPKFSLGDIVKEKRREALAGPRRIHVELLVRLGQVMPVRYTNNATAWKKYLLYAMRKLCGAAAPGALHSVSRTAAVPAGAPKVVEGPSAAAKLRQPHTGSRPVPSAVQPKAKPRGSSNAEGIATSLTTSAAAATAAPEQLKLVLTREHSQKLVAEFHDMDVLMADQAARARLEKAIWTLFAAVRQRTGSAKYCFFRSHIACGVTVIETPSPEDKAALLQLLDAPEYAATRPRSVLVPVTCTFLGTARDYRRIQKGMCTQPFAVNSLLVSASLDEHPEHEHCAATLIQAVFKRFIVRRHFAAVRDIVETEAAARRQLSSSWGIYTEHAVRMHRRRVLELFFDAEASRRAAIMMAEDKGRREKGDVQRVEAQAREMLLRREIVLAEERFRMTHMETLSRNFLVDVANDEYTRVLRLHRLWFRCHWGRYYIALARHQENLKIRASARKVLHNVATAPVLECPPSDFDFATTFVTLPQNIRQLRASLQQAFDLGHLDRIATFRPDESDLFNSPRGGRVALR